MRNGRVHFNASRMRGKTVGTPADTPHTLRMKAAEFLRLAEAARDFAIMTELRELAAAYQRRAEEVEQAGG